jgi:hypothetical protein
VIRNRISGAIGVLTDLVELRNACWCRSRDVVDRENAKAHRKKNDFEDGEASKEIHLKTKNEEEVECQRRCNASNERSGGVARS